MKKRTLIASVAIACMLYFSFCNSGSSVKNGISTDSLTIAKGEASFDQYCGGCHNFKQDGIGPQLGGITNSASADWIRHFINNPKKIIEAGDARALQLSKRFKTTMPSFEFFTDDQVQGIIAFLNVHTQPGKQTKEKGNEIKNPVPEPIPLSGLEAGLQLVAQVPPSSDSGKMQLTRITKLAPQPTTGNLFILDLRGKLYQLQHNKPQVYMDIAKLRPAFINEPGLATGFGSFAFHPQFESNGLLYTSHTEAHTKAKKADFGFADSIKVTVEWVLMEWKTTTPAAPVFSGTGRELFRVDMVTGIHGVQEIAFNPLAKPGDEDYGLLYIGVGDGGSVENGYPFLAHSREKPWGAILRIDPAGSNSANRQYGIPPGNPFVKGQNANALKEIYAYGFRNPHRITWTRSGQLLACNIGQANIESVNLIQPGHDYGWPLREGNFVLEPDENMERVYPLPANDSIYHFTYPVAEYDHDEGAAISGGYEYWGAAIPQLKGKYLFGDIPSGRLFYINLADIRQGKQAPIKEWKATINGKTKTLKELCGADRVDLHFGADARGELYILTKADGKVYQLTGAVIK